MRIVPFSSIPSCLLLNIQKVGEALCLYPEGSSFIQAYLALTQRHFPRTMSHQVNNRVVLIQP